jgi:hypothetical protein
VLPRPCASGGDERRDGIADLRQAFLPNVKRALEILNSSPHLLTVAVSLPLQRVTRLRRDGLPCFGDFNETITSTNNVIDVDEVDEDRGQTGEGAALVVGIIDQRQHGGPRCGRVV